MNDFFTVPFEFWVQLYLCTLFVSLLYSLVALKRGLARALALNPDNKVSFRFAWHIIKYANIEFAKLIPVSIAVMIYNSFLLNPNWG